MFKGKRMARNGTTGDSTKLCKRDDRKSCNCTIFEYDSLAVARVLLKHVLQRLSGILFRIRFE